jgi:hypothetical protein
MRYSKIWLLLIMTLPWLTLPLLGKRTLKQYLPASLFIAFIGTVECIIARRRRWWKFHITFDQTVGGLHLILGPFLVGSLWILKYTYGKLRTYLITNLIVDTIYIYSIINLLKKLGMFSLFRLNKIQLSLLFFIKSLLLYSFQFIKEKLVKGKGKTAFYRLFRLTNRL